MRFRAFFSVAAAISLVAGLSISATAPATALSSYNIKVAEEVVRVNTKVTVVVESLYSAKNCRLRVVGPATSKTVKKRVRNSAARAKIRVPRVPGQYRVRAACRGSGTALSEPFAVVAATSPERASCDVVETGFSAVDDDRTEALYGVIVRNASPELVADDVELALTFTNAAGAVIRTESENVRNIAPGSDVFVTGETSTGEVPASMTVQAKCTTETDPTEAVPGVVVGGVTRDLDSGGDFYWQGQFTNSFDQTIDSNSRVVAIFRDANGRIVGGDSTSLDSFITPGATGTWNAWACCYLGFTSLPSVQVMIFPRFE